jgi:plasmid maintenance system antidote protein VapI
MVREVEPVQMLKTYVAQFDTQKEAAGSLGVHASYLSALLNERQDIPDTLLTKIGLRRIVVKETK